ncbi:MAG TPA: PAS domain S-box protein [Chitinophagaceae bacterium]|nr:PAS domain S-box protein [Chitinophagaceae bacterium]
MTKYEESRDTYLARESARQGAEHYLRMVEEIEDYAIILLNTKGIIQNWNKGATKIKGYEAEEIIGKHFRVFYTEADRKAGLPETLLGEAAKNGRATHEGLRVKKDGSTFWGNIVITALHDDHNNVVGFTKVTRDLTARKQAEDELRQQTEYLIRNNEQLRQSEERYHKMVAEVKDYAILLLDKEGIIQNWNAGAERIKGYKANEIVGKSFTNFYLPADVAAGLPYKLLKEAEEQGRASHEGWRMRKDGSKFWGNVVITALHDDENNVIGFTKVTRDLTEKKKADERLHEYAHQLERKNEELEEFAYVASHDLKEPLRKILAFGDLLYHSYKEKIDDRMDMYITRMRDSAYRMMTLIDDLLRFSRIGNEQEQFELTNLNTIIQDVLQDFEATIKEKKAEITVGQLPIIMARPSQLHQLFQNLIGNALKFNDKPVPEIKISSVHLDERLAGKDSCRITVEDNGIGFSNEYKNSIFDIFQRLHGQSDYGGSGIGLAICKKIVEAHQGQIEAYGAEGRGATFVITIPC